MKILRPFRQLLKGSKTTELKQPRPQDILFVVPTLISGGLLLKSFYRILQTLLENQKSKPIRIGEIFGMDTEWFYVQKLSLRV